MDERGVGGGIKESAAGAVRAGGLRAAFGGGDGAASGAKKGKAEERKSISEVEEAAVSAGWFPNSMCPHKYQNSFACEKNNGGCKR